MIFLDVFAVKLLNKNVNIKFVYYSKYILTKHDIMLKRAGLPWPFLRRKAFYKNIATYSSSNILIFRKIIYNIY